MQGFERRNKESKMKLQRFCNHKGDTLCANLEKVWETFRHDVETSNDDKCHGNKKKQKKKRKNKSNKKNNNKENNDENDKEDGCTPGASNRDHGDDHVEVEEVPRKKSLKLMRHQLCCCWREEMGRMTTMMIITMKEYK